MGYAFKTMTLVQYISILCFCLLRALLAVTLQSSCNSLRDGLHYIQPLPHESAIPVICDAGYTMIDPSLHFASVASYLSSLDFSRQSAQIFSSQRTDFVNWREWWRPADRQTTFTVAPQCGHCDVDDSNDNAYFQSSEYFCFKSRSSRVCNVSDAELSIYCNQCDDSEHDSSEWTQCSAIRMNADHSIETRHSLCVDAQSIMVRPSMVTDRAFCSCYKPSNASQTEYEYNAADLPAVTLSLKERRRIPFIAQRISFSDVDANSDSDQITISDSDSDSHRNVHFLSNADFVSGTYRIRESGAYIITEDIIFDFNAPSDAEQNAPNFSPNRYDSFDVDGDSDLFWFPRRDQTQFEGLYAHHGLYALGFFAGITVEADDVLIDLNGHSLSMSHSFYIQQRFFSILELADRFFLPSQGPGDFGVTEQFYARNATVRNGVIGRSSHHGIHANNAQRIRIQNVTVRDFDVAGIALNGCNDVDIKNTNVGPQNMDIPVLGRYAHARTMLPRIQQLVDGFGDETVTFAGRETETVRELADRLVRQMDAVYFDAMSSESNSDRDSDDLTASEWSAAQKLFVNFEGAMDGGSSYGIVLSGEGSSTVAIGQRTEGTSNIRLCDVEIFGIRNAAREKRKMVDGDGALRGMLSEAIDWDAVVDAQSGRYLGDAYSDLVFAATRVQSQREWYFLHCARVTDELQNFVFGDGDSFDIDFECNTDIQLHSNKGAMALRVDGVQGLELRRVHIADVSNVAVLGSDLCGEYNLSTISSEDARIQRGFTGNNAHGLILVATKGVFADVTVDGVRSAFGSSVGVSVRRDCELRFEGAVRVSEVTAGDAMSRAQVQKLTLPNTAPEACSIAVGVDAKVLVDGDVDAVFGNSVVGFALCDESELMGDCFGCHLVNDESAVLTFGGAPLWLIGFAAIVMCVLGFSGCSLKVFARWRRVWTAPGAYRRSHETLPLLS